MTTECLSLNIPADRERLAGMLIGERVDAAASAGHRVVLASGTAMTFHRASNVADERLALDVRLFDERLFAANIVGVQVDDLGGAQEFYVETGNDFTECLAWVDGSSGDAWLVVDVEPN